jgi:poly(3-hydroxyalkanoate) synthetase
MTRHQLASLASKSAIINALAFYVEFHNNGDKMGLRRKRWYQKRFDVDNEAINYEQLLKEIYKENNF